MPSELLYWSLLSVLFIVPCVAAVIILKLSKKFGLSLLLSFLINVALTVIASLWWYNISTEPRDYTIGRIAFFIITLVSTQIIILFALFAMRKNPEASSEAQGSEYPSDES